MSSSVAPISVNVFADVGVKDTDDELLIKYFSSLKNHPLNLTIVFMGSDGLTPSQALVYWVREFDTNVLSHKNPLTSITYVTISEYRENPVECDFALQIAPMGGYDGHNLTVHNSYVFAGDYDTPHGSRDSFNKAGSQEILDRFNTEGKLVDMSSQHMSSMRFDQDLMSKFEEPFKSNIVFTAFLLAFGRMDPEHSANMFAEGLINPSLGRGVNYKSVMTMGKNLGAPAYLLDVDRFPKPRYASLNYFKELQENGAFKDKGNEINPKSVQCLDQMNDILAWIHGNSSLFVQNGDSVFYSDFDIYNIPEILKPSWELFKKHSDCLVDCYNPVYDLFAGYVLVGIIEGEGYNRKEHSVEQFREIICKEF